MPTFSFDIVSDYDKAEMNNVYMQAEKEIAGRYDFKGTPAGLEWLGDKTGFKLIGAGEWQVDAVLDIVRKKLASREISSKVLDLSKEVVESNLKATKEIPFKKGLSQDNAKLIAKAIRDEFKKAKPVIQGDELRVTSASKDELQAVMSHVRALDIDAPLQFVNFR
ncbi:YajQ family cyclic di-GMP-binding protein [Candidatus Mycosynbacter amalyticus]|uniref:Nucleotide-binding protein GII36_02950 n=1 Tax=Candidatus Mycosynbacter amalyticus TaxID=2665156 RepID=A0A857MNE9_9BACT|nr:YajQ family cyclic di-GMP-binding protein [Candidatus Mycosynbacter amalyticus]QHN42799.1 YajQ family cyclic di-GMP-binding protein [Candidatus Mycosynbacter amalyticus]